MLRSYFLQPFPMVRSTGQKLRIILSVSLFVLFFHGIFEPFGVRTYDASTKVFVLLAYTLICAVVLSINLFLVMRAFPRIFQAEKWNNARELLWILWNIVIIALVTFYFKTSQGFYPANLTYLVNILVSAFAIGIIPASLYIMANRLIYLRNFQPFVRQVLPEYQPASQRLEPLILKADRGDAQLEVERKSILYMVSDHNYVCIHLRDQQEGVRIEKLRAGLSSMENALAGHSEFFRCHRAFIVNLDAVESIKGNVKSSNLQLKGVNDTVPVSRQHIQHLRKRLKP